MSDPNVLKKAEGYYPILWKKNQIEQLVNAGKIDRADADRLYAEKDK